MMTHGSLKPSALRYLKVNHNISKSCLWFLHSEELFGSLVIVTAPQETGLVKLIYSSGTLLRS
jgi:hypothetical protein